MKLDLDELYDLELDVDQELNVGDPELYRRMWAYSRAFEACPICDGPAPFSSMVCSDCERSIEGMKYSDNADWLAKVRGRLGC